MNLVKDISELKIGDKLWNMGWRKNYFCIVKSIDENFYGRFKADFYESTDEKSKYPNYTFGFSFSGKDEWYFLEPKPKKRITFKDILAANKND